MRLLTLTLIVAAAIMLPTTIEAVGRLLAPQQIFVPIKYVKLL